MYYEEKIINGVLMCRNNPSGEWKQCSIAKMSSDIIALKQQLADLKANHNKIKAEALSDLIEDYLNGPMYQELTISYIYSLIDKLEAGNE